MAENPFMPVRRRMATSSAFRSASAPQATNRSRGRSLSGRSFIRSPGDDIGESSATERRNFKRETASGCQQGVPKGADLIKLPPHFQLALWLLAREAPFLANFL